jgi:DNA polymerase-3 subunit alpha
MNALEKAGMLKMDFLGLTTLTVIKDALDAIEMRTGTRPNLDVIGDDDPEVYRMLRAGTNDRRVPVRVAAGDGHAARDAMRPLRRPRGIERADAARTARRGDASRLSEAEAGRGARSPTSFPSSRRSSSPTYGVITYQEQVMRIAQVLAGISLAEADVLRKAVGKKDAELIKQELGKFVTKAVARGHDKRIIEDIAGTDRDVRPLRLQQVALGRLFGHLVPHRVAQGAPPGRVHGRAAVVVDRRHGQRRQVHQ